MLRFSLTTKRRIAYVRGADTLTNQGTRERHSHDAFLLRIKVISVRFKRFSPSRNHPECTRFSHLGKILKHI